MTQLILPLIVFMLGNQVIAGTSSTKLPLPKYGNAINILSIDAGGIKGIIPAVVLDHLDKAFKAKDPKTSIADYFDVIGGTSTSGLIAAMLATENPYGTIRPPLTPAEIAQFYKENGPHIFNYTHPRIPPFLWTLFVGTKYDGEFLHNITREILKETRLSEALTNLVISAYDVKKAKPIIFSTLKLKTDPSLDAKLSDICIATSAAPLQLPPYYFENGGKQFNLIDGGVFAGNPTLVAVSEAIQHEEHRKFRLLSLGTGATNVSEQFDVEAIANWKLLDWLYHADLTTTDLTDYFLATISPHLNYGEEYLRIQEYNLDPSMTDAENVKKENLDNLEKEGHNLLQQNALKINQTTFAPEQTNLGTNAEALERFAEILYKERQLRLKNEAMEKRGRPFIKTVV